MGFRVVCVLEIREIIGLWGEIIRFKIAAPFYDFESKKIWDSLRNNVIRWYKWQFFVDNWWSVSAN